MSYGLCSMYWNGDHCTLRMVSGGIDFCDLCTGLKDNLRHLPLTDEFYSVKKDLFSGHRLEARARVLNYQTYRQEVKYNPSGSGSHLVFDFAEKVLLAHLQHKFDLFRLSSSYKSTN